MPTESKENAAFRAELIQNVVLQWHSQDHYRHGDKAEEEAVVRAANAVVEPLAVVVSARDLPNGAAGSTGRSLDEPDDALVAAAAVLAALVHVRPAQLRAGAKLNPDTP